MPDSVGKRQRRDAKAKKAVAREDRRVARAKRQADRDAGLIEAGTPIQASEPAALGLLPSGEEPRRVAAPADVPPEAPPEAPAEVPAEAPAEAPAAAPTDGS